MTVVQSGKTGSIDTPLAAAGPEALKYTTDPIEVEGDDRVTITVAADQTGKVRVWQGMSEANFDDFVTELSFAAFAAAGDGDALTVELVGLWCAIEIQNDSGVDMTITRMGWKIKPLARY